MPRLGRFTSGKDPVPTVQRAGWAPGQVWTDAENLASIGIRCLSRRASSVVAIPTELSQPPLALKDQYKIRRVNYINPKKGITK